MDLNGVLGDQRAGGQLYMHVRARCLNAFKDYSGKLPVKGKGKALSLGQNIELNGKGNTGVTRLFFTCASNKT